MSHETIGPYSLWTFDAETFYTDKAGGEYSLTWMTPEEYIRDPRFDPIGFSLKPGSGEARWFTGTLEEQKAVLHSLDWSRILVIGHNMSEFDALILTEIYDVHPAGFICTLQMARAVFGAKNAEGKNFGKSLALLAKHFGLQVKGEEVKYAINKRRVEFTTWQLAQYGAYCANDSDLCWEIFCRLRPQFPVSELMIASLCTSMFAYARLELDIELLRAMQVDLITRKREVLLYVADMLGVNNQQTVDMRVSQTQSLLRKDAVLANLLRDRFGIDPPMKPSPTRLDEHGNALMVYAFAKTDEGMEELLEDEDEDVQALASARLGVKSTIAESRIARFIGIGMRGKLTVANIYGKTHTDRLAGGQKTNLQNLGGSKPVDVKTRKSVLISTPGGITRLRDYNTQTGQLMTVDGTIYSNKKEEYCHVVGLRDTIKAPPGMRLVVVDSSQIELRVCHLLAGQMDTVDELRRGADVYSSFASTVYARPITKEDKKERQHGKVGMLQLQYQSGGGSFRKAARTMGQIRLSADEADATVKVYRARFTEIVKFWYACQKAIVAMSKGGGTTIDQWGLCRTENNQIVVAGGRPIQFFNLRQELMKSFNAGEPDEMQWVYDDKEERHIKKTYGGCVTENLCQKLARNVVLAQALEIEKKYGAFKRHGSGVVLTVHDEAVMCVPEDKAEECLKFSLECFAQPPAWWPLLPVAAEGGIGVRYADCK
jgi:hypothetical protein